MLVSPKIERKIRHQDTRLFQEFLPFGLIHSKSVLELRPEVHPGRDAASDYLPDGPALSVTLFLFRLYLHSSLLQPSLCSNPRRSLDWGCLAMFLVFCFVPMQFWAWFPVTEPESGGCAPQSHWTGGDMLRSSLASHSAGYLMLSALSQWTPGHYPTSAVRGTQRLKITHHTGSWWRLLPSFLLQHKLRCIMWSGLPKPKPFWTAFSSLLSWSPFQQSPYALSPMVQ